MLYRVEGLVIRSTDYGEGNKIITLLTPTYGKQGIVVRGAKKLKSRYGSLAQLFTYGDFSYYKTGTLGTLNSGEIIESFRELREGLEGPAYAAYASELTDRAINDDEAAAHLFHQLKACQSALAGGKDPQIVIRAYEMKVVNASGYAPMLDECVNCGRQDGPFRFSAAAGGALCLSCKHKDPTALELEETVWKLLRVFSALDLRRLGNIAVRDSSKRQLQLALRRWMDVHLNLNLKSRNFLDQWEKYGDLLGERMKRPEPIPETEAGEGKV
ncbi:DNA repair protein RecO [Cohnella lupini]|uniref:DNA repair protein RecO n=1 Tax=Cohnella lupini TaxID=1294267 RepID=A0A3D9IVX5_9BACL|nr:DNA repair protein RecO [Cohnella lupini]RED65727.1 DNA replication and repair protein RecO [Cohnella lupini]